MTVPSWGSWWILQTKHIRSSETHAVKSAGWQLKAFGFSILCVCVLVPVFFSGVLHRKWSNCGCWSWGVGVWVARTLLGHFPFFLLSCPVMTPLSLSNKHHELKCKGLTSNCLLNHLSFKKKSPTQRTENVENKRFFSRFVGWDCWAAEWTNGRACWRRGGDGRRGARAWVWRPSWTSRGRRGGANKGGQKARVFQLFSCL